MRWGQVVVAMAFLAAVSVSMPHAVSQTLLERGRYLVTIMDCGGCHTPGALGGQPDETRALAGSAVV